MSRTRGPIILGVAALIAAAVFFWPKTIPPQPPVPQVTQPESAQLESFNVSDGSYLVAGQNLDAVEIWGVPTGTQISEDEHAKLYAITDVQTVEGMQQWKLNVVDCELLVTELYAVGYKNGKEVGRISLKATGASSISEYICSQI